MRDSRLLIVLGAAVVAVVLFIVFRRSGDDDESAQPPPPPAITTDTTATDTAEPPPPAAPVTRIEIAVRGGKPVGGIRRVTVDRGRRVVLIVTSDIADEVHVHGYDLQRDVGPGKPVRLAFAANLPGGFEVELEEHQLPIADLSVQP